MDDFSSDFEATEEWLRARRTTKWTTYGADILPAWIAESDFRLAEPVMRSASRLLAEEDFGYPRREDGTADFAVSLAFSRRMQSRFGWQVSAGDVQVVTDLVQAVVAAIMAFSDEGDGVVVQTPCYPPFRDAIAATGRTFVDQPMIAEVGRYAPDLAALEKAAVSGAKVLILCNPHNPTGSVFSLKELQTIGEIAVRTGMIIVSDEIHGDLLFDGAVHIPIASLGDAISAQTVTITSPTKSFNTPGLRCGVMHFGSPALKAVFHRRIPAKLIGRPSVFGIDAAVAAWDEGQPWLEHKLDHLGQLRTKVSDAVDRMPGLAMTTGQGTYFAWIDCTGLGLNEPAGAFFHREAKLAFSAGETFGPQWRNWIRLNFATSSSLVDEMLARLGKAVDEAGTTPSREEGVAGHASEEAQSHVAY
jgi:cystathionine beta-lyase